MTFLTVINTVLRQLRENEANSVTENDYTQLIGQFATQVIEEMEDRWDWSRYFRSVDCTVAAGLSEIDLSTANVAAESVTRATNERSKLAFDEKDKPMVYEITSGEEGQLNQRNQRTFSRRYSVDTRSTGAPSEFAVKQKVGEYWSLRFNTNMDKEREFRSFWYIPEDTLDVTSNDDAGTSILLPTRPIILGTLYYAYNERGEEIGEPGGIAERRWLDALAAAIENDDSEKQSYLYRTFTNDESSRNTVYRGPGTSYGVS